MHHKPRIWGHTAPCVVAGHHGYRTGAESSALGSRQPNDGCPAERTARPRAGRADIGVSRSARNRAFLSARSITFFLALLFVMTTAHAAEQNQTPTSVTASGATSNFIASPLSVAVAVTSANSGQTFNTADFAGGAGTYSPAINVSATTFNFTSTVTTTPMPVGTIRGVGTVTLTFSRPVTNPRLHFSRLGGFNGATNEFSYFQTTWDLMTAGATMTVISGQLATADNPSVAGADALRIQALNPRATTQCVNPPPANTELSGCGTVQINGTFSTLTFNASLWYRDRQPAAPVNQNGGDAYGVAITLNEDFGDAPSSYGAAPHVVDNVQLGAVATPAAGAHPSEADATTTLYTAYPATSPVSNATATGDTDNALTLPLPQVGVGTYTLTVPVSARTGSASGAQVCGWIDFNRDGSFTDGAPEEACATAGAANATLTWTIPTGATYVAGQSYMRLRIGLAADAAQVSNPTTPAASGEAEDYQITLLPRVRLTKLLSPTTDTGAFNLSVSPNVAAAVGPGTSSVTNVGHNGTTGFVPVPLNTAITVQETAGTGTALANYASVLSCLNRAGASVASGTTSAGFTSMTSAPTAAPTVPATTANSDASEISCTVTNTRRTADVTITKTSTSNPVVSGGLVTYSIVVTNNGPATAPGAIVTDDWTVAPGLDCSTAAGGSATCAATGTAGTQCPAALTPAALQAGIAIPGFPNGGTVTFTLQCRVTATGQ